VRDIPFFGFFSALVLALCFIAFFGFFSVLVLALYFMGFLLI
jgi:hypothetical protein